jgi:soluble lytic murein transglycosylase-like protein
MIRFLFLFIASALANSAYAGTVIKKIVDSSGHVIYTNLTDAYRGKIIKRFDSEGITHFRNVRPSLSNQIVKTGSSHYNYRFGSNYPAIFSSFGNSYYPRQHEGGSANKSRFSTLISDAATRHRVDEKLLHAVIQTESAYNPSAVSRAGAVGLMQLMPETARRYGVINRTDPAQNVNGGTKYLRDLLDMFNYNLRLAVAAYNAGENAVMKYNYSIPPYPETQNYVRQVLSRYNRSL